MARGNTNKKSRRTNRRTNNRRRRGNQKNRIRRFDSILKVLPGQIYKLNYSVKIGQSESVKARSSKLGQFLAVAEGDYCRFIGRPGFYTNPLVKFTKCIIIDGTKLEVTYALEIIQTLKPGIKYTNLTEQEVQFEIGLPDSTTANSVNAKEFLVKYKSTPYPMVQFQSGAIRLGLIDGLAHACLYTVDDLTTQISSTRLTHEILAQQQQAMVEENRSRNNQNGQ